MEWIVPKTEHSPERPLFLCVLANTETAYIPKLSGAGASPELTDFTPAGDAELVETGGLVSFDSIPMTPPHNTPTPAVITRAALSLTGIPYIFVNAGLKVTPAVEYVDLEASPGQDVRKPLAVPDAQEIFDRAVKLGEELSDKTDFLVIGESIAGGTTTAKGVLTALGYDGNVSSSSAENPLELKNRVVKEGMESSNVTFGSLRDDPMQAIKCLGDPMMPAVAGIVSGFKGGEVILASGTQMVAIYAIIKHLGINTDHVSIVTTCYVANDESASFMDLINELGATMYCSNPGFEKSGFKGLQRYVVGDVKEGVGAGGALYLAYLKGISQDEVRQEIENICNKLLE